MGGFKNWQKMGFLPYEFYFTIEKFRNKHDFKTSQITFFYVVVVEYKQFIEMHKPKKKIIYHNH